MLLYAYDLFPEADEANSNSSSSNKSSREGRIHSSSSKLSSGVSSSSSTSKKNEDLLRFHYPEGKYQLVHEWNFTAHAQGITAMACMNSVQSSLILCSSSDK